MRKAEAKYNYKLPEPKKYRKSWYYYPIEYDNPRSYSVPIRSRRGRFGLT